jgi:hypothetical protein
MMFPAGCATLRARMLSGIAAFTMLMAAVIAVPNSVVRADPADPPPPPLRHVQYTVWTEQPYGNGEIYYRDTDPPNWGEYSHNPYLYSPNVEAHVGPDQKWNLDVYLANPDSWAMVIATTASDSTAKPNFHCVLAVDGVVVKTAQGPKGALCSIRPW